MPKTRRVDLKPASSSIRAHILVTAVALSGLVLSSPGQSPAHRLSRQRPEGVAPAVTMRADANLVLVPVTVTDAGNHPLTDLGKENFRLYDNKVEQTLTAFSRDDQPLTLGLVFDTSSSMKGTLPQARRAVAELLKLANSGDDFFLVEFDKAPRLTVPLTSDFASINTELLLSNAHGPTAVVDAVYFGLQEAHRSIKTRRAIIVFSDGADNSSRLTEQEIDRLVRESDVLIYTVLIPGLDEDSGFLGRIAEMTGGRGFTGRSNELPQIASKINWELRNRYVLGYTPAMVPRDGRYHRITVKVIFPRARFRVRVHWRAGYYALSDFSPTAP